MATRFLLEVECYVGGATVAGAHTVAGSGQQSWTMAAGAPMPLDGMWLRLEVTTTPATYMEGVVYTVDAVARTVGLDIRASAGSGSHSAWTASTGMLRFSTHRDATLPTESPANLRFLPRVIQAGEIARFMFDRGTTGGASRTEAGDMTLANADGVLDPLLDYGLDGRAAAIRVATVRDEYDERPAYPGDYTLVLSGTAGRAMADFAALTIPLRTRQFDLDKPFQPTLYAGSNALPAGLEGTAEDLKGKPKPKLLTSASNLSPPCVNTARLIYQVSDDLIAAVSAVYDNGIALTAGAAYASQVDMEVNAPAASGYRVWLNAAGSYIRLGSTPAGTITADASYHAVPSVRAAGSAVNRIAAAAIPGLTIVTQDSIDFLALQPAEIELWVSEDVSVPDLLDRICGSVGAWWGFDRLGQFRMKRLDSPTGGTPVLTFRKASAMTPLATAEADILSFELYAPGDQDGGLPVADLTLTYGPNWTVQTVGDLAGAVTPARRAWLANGSRNTAKATNAATRTRHPLAGSMTVETLLKVEADAVEERDRLLAMRSPRRDRAVLATRLDTTTPAIELGDEVKVVLARFGYDAGRSMRVTSARLDARAQVLTLELWG